MPDVPRQAITDAKAAVRARHAQISTAAVIEYDEPEFEADIVTALDAAAPHIRAQDATRITELRKLAAAMLATFHRTSDGYRARTGQVQVGRWRIALDWENDPDA